MLETSESDLKKAVQDFIQEKPLRFLRATLTRYHRQPVCVANLPQFETQHFRGIMIEGEATYGRASNDARSLDSIQGSSKREFTPHANAILCHVKRQDDPYVDIPDRADLYALLRYQFDRLGMRFKDHWTVIERTRETWPTMLRLRDWERSHPYRRSRLRKLSPSAPEYELEERYAASALRGVGLVWPGKPHIRRRNWVECIRDLGLTVHYHSIAHAVHREKSKRQNQVPKTGAYFWIPKYSASTGWFLRSFPDEMNLCISHESLWSEILLGELVAAFACSGRMALQLRGKCSGLPRGTVVLHEGMYVVCHGNDAPTRKWQKQIVEAFGLAEKYAFGKVRFVFDQEMTTLESDRKAVEQLFRNGGLRNRRVTPHE